MSKKILLLSESEVKSQSIVETNVDARIISKSILNVQETHLRGILGASIYDDLLSQVELYILSGTSLSTSGATLLNDYIRPYLLHASIVDLLISNQYKISNKGVMKLNDQSATALSADELEFVLKEYKNSVTTYKEALEKYLHGDRNFEHSNSSISWFLSKERHYPNQFHYYYPYIR